MAQKTFYQKLQYILSVDDKEFNFKGSVLELEAINNAVIDMLSGIDNMYDEMIMLASELETAMANVSTLLDTDATGMDKFTDAIIKLSTEVPESAVGLSEGLYQVISAGVDTADSMSVLEVASRSATAGMTSTYTAVDAITTILNAYNMDASEASKVSDILFTTVKRGKTTFGELSSYVGTFATNASTLGISLTDVNAAMATMTKKGLSTAKSATSLDAIMREITQKKDIVKVFKDAGYETGQLALKQLGLQGSLKLLAEQSKKTGRDFSSLWGDEARRGANIMGMNTEMATKDLEAFDNTLNAHVEAYDKAVDTLQNKEQLRYNAQDALLTQMGQELLPIHVAYNEVLTTIFKTMVDKGGASTKYLAGLLAIAKGTSTVAQKTSTWMRNLVALKEGKDILTPFLRRLKEVGKSTGKSSDGLSGLSQMLGKVGLSAKGASTQSTNLKNAIGSAGLGLAVAFTTGQLIKLGHEVKNYMDAVKSLDEVQEKGIEIAKELEKDTGAYYGNARDALKELQKVEEERGFFDGLAAKGLNDRANAAKKELEALGYAYSENHNWQAQIDTAERKRQEAKERWAVKNKVLVDEKVEEEKKAQDEILSRAEQVQEKLKRLKQLGGFYTLTGSDPKSVEKDMLAIEKKISAILRKNAETREKDIAKLNADTAKAIQKNDLRLLKKNTIEKTKLEIEEAKKLYAKQIELAGENETKIEEANAEYTETVKAHYTNLEMQTKIYYGNLFKIQSEQQEKERLIRKNDKDWKEAVDASYAQKDKELTDSLNEAKVDVEKQLQEDLAEVRQDTEEQENEELQRKEEAYKAFYETLATQFGEAIGESFTQGAEGLKEALKNTLFTILDFIKMELMATYVSIGTKGILSGGLTVLPDLAKMTAIEAGFAVAKNAVASFDDGGIPTTAGMAMVHPTDVIVNPTTDNEMMNALTNRLADKINDRQQEVKLVINERELGRATINSINRENDTLPKGRRFS